MCASTRESLSADRKDCAGGDEIADGAGFDDGRTGLPLWMQTATHQAHRLCDASSVDAGEA